MFRVFYSGTPGTCSARADPEKLSQQPDCRILYPS